MRELLTEGDPLIGQAEWPTIRAQAVRQAIVKAARSNNVALAQPSDVKPGTRWLVCLNSAALAAPFVAGTVFQRLISNVAAFLGGNYAIDTTYSPSLARVSILGVLMVLGILFSVLYEAFGPEDDTKKVVLSRVLKSALSGQKLWRALLLSPFVFYFIYSHIGAEPDNVLAMFFSFQNGFFWQVILHRPPQGSK